MITPYQAYFGQAPELSSMRTFGSTCYFWISKGHVHHKSTVHLRHSAQLDMVYLLDMTTIGGHIWFYPMEYSSYIVPKRCVRRKGDSTKNSWVLYMRQEQLIQFGSSRGGIRFYTSHKWGERERFFCPK